MTCTSLPYKRAGSAAPAVKVKRKDAYLAEIGNNLFVGLERALKPNAPLLLLHAAMILIPIHVIVRLIEVREVAHAHASHTDIIRTSIRTSTPSLSQVLLPHLLAGRIDAPLLADVTSARAARSRFAY